jgi:hypothetical protein
VGWQVRAAQPRGSMDPLELRAAPARSDRRPSILGIGWQPPGRIKALMAVWPSGSGSGLQSRLPGFESRHRLSTGRACQSSDCAGACKSPARRLDSARRLQEMLAVRLPGSLQNCVTSSSPQRTLQARPQCGDRSPQPGEPVSRAPALPRSASSAITFQGKCPVSQSESLRNRDLDLRPVPLYPDSMGSRS